MVLNSSNLVSPISFSRSQVHGADEITLSGTRVQNFVICRDYFPKFCGLCNTIYAFLWFRLTPRSGGREDLASLEFASAPCWEMPTAGVLEVSASASSPSVKDFNNSTMAHQE